jgi:hypothetical protein
MTSVAWEEAIASDLLRQLAIRRNQKVTGSNPVGPSLKCLQMRPFLPWCGPIGPGNCPGAIDSKET